MSLSGQLSDLHLSELIEFFCNQRKTGRLKVDYALAPGVFFINEGQLVDAKVGALNGADAVHFALTLPSAAFDFSAGVQSSRRTINDPWASVVLEGLRRIDEGVAPAQFDAYPTGEELDEATRDYLNFLEEAKKSDAAAKPAGAAGRVAADAPAAHDATAGAAPLSMMVEASNGGGRSKVMVASVVAAVLVVCAVAAIPVSRRLMRKDAPAAAAQPAPAAEAAQSPAQQPDGAAPAAGVDAQHPADISAEEEAAAAARRETREREARERARRQREEAAKNAAEDPDAAAPAPKPAAAGPKTVRVSVSYDEAGRVTQASAVGTSPGAEAYAATAVRIARGRRFTPGKAGGAVITIPIN